jgi:esterase FrsA
MSHASALLFAGLVACAGTAIASPVQPLQSDQMVAPLQMPAGSHRLFSIDVPAGATQVGVRLLAGAPTGRTPASGDATLSVKAGAPPDAGDATCRSAKPGLDESCQLAHDGATRYYIRVDAISTVAGASLVAAWQPPGADDEDAFEDWYRTITPKTWIDQGADRQTIERVLKRIERATGPRRDPAQPDTVIAFGPGHWVHEWNRAADAALKRARKAANTNDRATAKTGYLEAIHYYNIASYPHLNHDTHAMAALEASQAAYREATPYLHGTTHVLDLRHDGKPFQAYLHVPPGEGPFPVLIKSPGSDIVKEIYYRSYERALAPRGIAVLLLDMPGIGASRAHTLTRNSDKLHAAALRQLQQHGAAIDDRLDTDRIAVEGASFGGHAAARHFLRRDSGVVGVVSVCGPLDGIFNAPAHVYARSPRMTMDAVRSRVGLAPESSWEAFAAKMRPFALGPAGQHLLPARHAMDTPLLAIATLDDPVAPLEDIALLAEASNDAQLTVFGIEGHCPDRKARDEVIATWLDGVFQGEWRWTEALQLAYRRSRSGHPECASFDGRHCAWGVAPAAFAAASLKPLSCGPAHARVHAGMTGYESPGHWCSQLAPAVGHVPWRWSPKLGVSHRVNPEGKVECASHDGRNCLWGTQPAQLDIAALVPLACGPMHAAVFGTTGDDTPGHWCTRL